MSKDLMYTNGVIAVRETYLLKDKLYKLCEADVEEAFRILSESGFGKGVEVESVYDYERLVGADEANCDMFIREYSPSAAESAYLLSPRDFHNAKALVKAYYLGLDVEKMLAGDGLVSVGVITQCIKDGTYEKLGKRLGGAVQEAIGLLSGEENKDVSGAEIGIIFEKALYAHLADVCAKNTFLKKLVAVKADMTNILTAIRSSDEQFAEKTYLAGGKLTEKQLSQLFNEDTEKASRAFDGTPYSAFVKKCLADKSAGLPLTEAERMFDSLEADFLKEKKYELKSSQPFLYYVFRRRAENANVRIIFVCLLAGMKEQDIKKRLRTY